MGIARGYKPKIINSDQGCQFTANEWIYQLTLLGVKISMDGKGRALDNIPIERFWRTIKYEEVYLNTYETVSDAKASLNAYISWYNTSRRHRGINHHRPYEVMVGAKVATDWAFKEVEKMAETRSCGYVDNSLRYHTYPQGPTTTTAFKVLMVKEEIKQHKKVKQAMNLSSKIAA